METIFFFLLLTTSCFSFLVESSDNNHMYSPCGDTKVERSDGFTFAIAFASRSSFFLNNSQQLSPCDRRLSLSSSTSQIAVFRPKVDEISLLTINTSSFSPDNYGGYMVAFAGRKYAARSLPAFVANSTYTVTSFTLALEFKKGRLRPPSNIYRCLTLNMELSSSFASLVSDNISFSSAISPFPLQSSLKTLKLTKPTSQNLRILAVAVEPQQDLPHNSPQKLLKELAERKKVTSPKKKVPPKKFILRPPLDDKKLVDRFLKSPQLSLKSFPLLSSCLPPSRLNNADQTWIDEYLLEAKQALGYSLEPSDQLGDDNPAKHFDTLLYLAFQHPFCERNKARHVRAGHSRLCFLGQFVLELAFCEFFLQRYPRESPAPMRERVFGLIGRRNLPKWIKAASLQNLIFPFDEMDRLIRKEREPPVKSVFWALFGAIYLCFGFPEVYRVLFEVFGMDPEDKECQPKLRRQLEDVDYVSVEFEGNKLTWQDVAAYKPPEDALFAQPRLFRACVPPGMHRFRGNLWDFDSRPQVMQTLGYPLVVQDRIPEITEARNIELGLGLQLCFLHPSKYKFEHPRFCFERLEYVGQKIQDLVMAERLLMKHLDAPGHWLQEKHRRILMNKFCGRYLREKNLHRYIIYSEQVQDAYEHNRRLRNPSTTAVQQALHGLAYTVYGKPDVRRVMFEVFDFEQIQPKSV